MSHAYGKCAFAAAEMGAKEVEEEFQKKSLEAAAAISKTFEKQQIQAKAAFNQEMEMKKMEMMTTVHMMGMVGQFRY